MNKSAQAVAGSIQKDIERIEEQLASCAFEPLQIALTEQLRQQREQLEYVKKVGSA